VQLRDLRERCRLPRGGGRSHSGMLRQNDLPLARCVCLRTTPSLRSVRLVFFCLLLVVHILAAYSRKFRTLLAAALSSLCGVLYAEFFSARHGFACQSRTTSPPPIVNAKSFPSHKAPSAALISVSLALSQTPVYTARPRIYGASASRGVPVYVPDFADTYCAYPRRDGQAELMV